MIVPSSKVVGHLKLLGKVLERINSAGLKLQPSKCHFGKRSVDYLDFVIAAGKLSRNPKKIEAIQNFVTPCCPKDIGQFIGLCQFYARLIPNFATLAVPLYDLQNDSKQKFVWTVVANEAFRKINPLMTRITFGSCLCFNFGNNVISTLTHNCCFIISPTGTVLNMFRLGMNMCNCLFLFMNDLNLIKLIT